jgi:hypothetical protein
MGLFKKEKSVEQLEEERDKVKIQADTAGYKSQIAEREAVVKQLKKQYGRDWSKLLGVSKGADMSTLKSFLTGAKSGLARTSVTVDPNIKKKLWGDLAK